MIIFRCFRCRERKEVPFVKYFKQCPKCHEMMFMNYYENVFQSTPACLDNMKGGEVMVEVKKPSDRKFGESKYGADVPKKAIALAKAGKNLNEIHTELNGPGKKAIQRWLVAANIQLKVKAKKAAAE